MPEDLDEQERRIPAHRIWERVLSLRAFIRLIDHPAPQVTFEPHRVCPVCRKSGRLLPDSSVDSIVEYYRCDDCGRIWSHRKDNPESPAKLVTLSRKL
jgi:hypothetical protein